MGRWEGGGGGGEISLIRIWEHLYNSCLFCIHLLLGLPLYTFPRGLHVHIKHFSYNNYYYTVEPLYKGHLGTSIFCP